MFASTYTAISPRRIPRSEEHTSELQSHSDLHSFPTRRSSDLIFQQIDLPSASSRVAICGDAHVCLNLHCNQPATYPLAYSFRARAGAQLSQNGTGMELHRVFRDPEAYCNFFVPQTITHQSKHFSFASRESLHRVRSIN